MKDPFIRQKFTRDLSFARQLAREYFERFPKDQYATEVESWRQIQSQNIEFTMKRLRERDARLMREPTGWCRPFDDPIDLPRGRKLVTLEDAGNYIAKLPKAEHTVPEWQDAMEALILVATRGGATMLARIGVLRALHRNVKRVFNPDRKDTHWGKRKLKRDQ